MYTFLRSSCLAMILFAAAMLVGCGDDHPGSPPDAGSWIEVEAGQSAWRWDQFAAATEEGGWVLIFGAEHAGEDSNSVGMSAPRRVGRHASPLGAGLAVRIDGVTYDSANDGSCVVEIDAIADGHVSGTYSGALTADSGATANVQGRFRVEMAAAESGFLQ